MRSLSLGAGALSVSFVAVAASAADEPAPAPPPPAPSPWGSMQAGGLAPPPPMEEGAPPRESPTERELDEARKQDTGRGLEWFWMDAHGGFEHVGLSTFSGKTAPASLGFAAGSSTGGVVDGGLGVRLLFVTLGARGRFGAFDAFTHFTVGGELGLHIPIGNFDPHLEGSAGYASFEGPKGSAARGVYGRFGGGLDYYVVPNFSLGIAANGDVLGLEGSSFTSGSVGTLTGPAKASGPKVQTLGGGVALTAVAGLHF